MVLAADGPDHHDRPDRGTERQRDHDAERQHPEQGAADHRPEGDGRQELELVEPGALDRPGQASP